MVAKFLAWLGTEKKIVRNFILFIFEIIQKAFLWVKNLIEEIINWIKGIFETDGKPDGIKIVGSIFIGIAGFILLQDISSNGLYVVILAGLGFLCFVVEKLFKK